MKPVVMACAIFAALVLQGCGAMGVLEEENAELHGKVDSLATLQHQTKSRVNYLENQNVKLDNRNKQLQKRITETGALPPSEYTVTGERPQPAAPAQARPIQESRPVQAAQPVQATQPVQAQAQTGQTANAPAAPPQAQLPPPQVQQPPVKPKAAPWRAEQYAIKSGAAAARPAGNRNWHYGDPEGGVHTGTYAQEYSRSNGEENQQPPTKWQYGDSNAGSYRSDYSQTFDTRRVRPENQPLYRKSAQGNASGEATIRPVPRVAIMAIPAVKPAPPQPPQSLAQPLPPATVDATPADMRRKADYSFLATYQKGYAAYQKGDYASCISVLTGLLSSSEVNDMSDNCEYWIAQSYRALGDSARANAYYARVLAYPSSDKAENAREELSRLR